MILLTNYISGDSDDTYDGLYIVDGSIIPCVLGVNPAFTITCIAERCMRLLAQDESWTTDYTLQPVSISNSFHLIQSYVCIFVIEFYFS